MPRVATTAAIARPVRTDAQLALANPKLAGEMLKIRSHIFDVVDTGTSGDPRGQLTVPVSPVPNPADTTLFEEAADATHKLYLPRYRLRSQGGRYEIGVTAAEDGNWRLTVGLERYPAPEIGDQVQGAGELPHTCAIFFRYGAGPSNTIEKTVDLTEMVEDAKGLAASTGLALAERDALLLALRTPAANPQLVVRRAISVAIHVSGGGDSRPKFTIRPLYFNRKVEIPPPAPVESIAATVQPMLLAAAIRPARGNFQIQPFDGTDPGLRIIDPVRHEPPIVRPVDRYETVDRVLDDLADPSPMLLDPLLHPYVYEGSAAAGGAGAAEFRRIVLAHPPGQNGARFHAYLQDRSEPWVFYHLPDRFRLARSAAPPFLPQMVVRIAAPDGAIETAAVTIDYAVAPSVDAERLAAAATALKAEVPAGARQAEPVLRPLQAAATLKLWVPGGAGPALRDQPDVAIDLANGFVHSLTVPLAGFRELYAAAYARDASSLFSGQVAVETGLAAPEAIPLEVRFADTEGDIFTLAEQPSTDGVVAVQMLNAIESRVRLRALPVRVRRGDSEAAGDIEGVSFDQPVELAPGASLSFTVRPRETLEGDGTLTALFDTSSAEVLPEPEAILPLISDTSVPAQYERQVEVMTVPDLLGDAADPAAILLINAEFQGGSTVKLSRDSASGVAQVQLPLIDLLLGRDTQGKYRFRQQIVRRNGTQTADPDWRESDFSLLVLPVT
jgi:hypothetical protein